MTVVRVRVDQETVCARSPLSRWWDIPQSESCLYLCYSDEADPEDPQYELEFNSSDGSLMFEGKKVGIMSYLRGELQANFGNEATLQVWLEVGGEAEGVEEALEGAKAEGDTVTIASYEALKQALRHSDDIVESQNQELGCAEAALEKLRAEIKDMANLARSVADEADNIADGIEWKGQ